MRSLLIAATSVVLAACSSDGGTEPEPTAAAWEGRWTDTPGGVRAVLRMSRSLGGSLEFTRLEDGETEFYGFDADVDIETAVIAFRVTGAQDPSFHYGWADATYAGEAMSLTVEPLSSSQVQTEMRAYSLTRQDTNPFGDP